MRRSNYQSAVQGIVAMLPLAIACVPWGVLTGALAIQAGFTPLQAQAMSLLVFAGAAQLSGLSMYAAGTGWASILGSTFVISSRHLLYSLTFRKHVERHSATQRWLIAFVLTDEMFAVSESDTRRHGTFCYTFALVSGFTFHIIWNISTALGIVAGEMINDLDQLGLDFAIAATFIAMTFDQVRRRPVLATIMVSGVTSVITKPLFPEAHIVLAAMVGMTVGFVLHEPEQDDSVQVKSHGSDASPQSKREVKQGGVK